ncbi:MAG: ACT domain-containing protein [Methanomicrobium sp.]|nr:ACT domain-containing protein [Methanomicrobium sp.]
MTENSESCRYVIKQISVFSENKPGRLSAIAKGLEDANVNIYAFSIAESKGFGVVRLIVDKSSAALKNLADIGFMVSYTDVIGIKMEDRPGGLYETASILGDADINIEYAYAYSGKNGAVLIIRVDDVTTAVKRLLAAGKELIRAEECK